MTISKGDHYTICIGSYPWTDEYARANVQLEGATLLTKSMAKQWLDSHTIEIIDPTPDQNLYFKGDLGLSGNWVKGLVKSGPLQNSTVAVLDIWLKSDECSCNINLLMSAGCQCGGN